ncbi:hypothetical protein SAMN02949497_0989 [Methylomagnum ishizawai]|uniref:Lipoprotein n=1 Tax=Methylomagnum ishizawai TaxID=1760988 RepID=A0A1Y6CZG8_9GAMM|nr:hypothetical protein [Methylomagnum ishizawai]SMF93702.1 hypothetical protein SAMN02949497_0989 [Methylomagnum ishizawai]
MKRLLLALLLGMALAMQGCAYSSPGYYRTYPVYPRYGYGLSYGYAAPYYGYRGYYRPYYGPRYGWRGGYGWHGGGWRGGHWH